MYIRIYVYTLFTNTHTHTHTQVLGPSHVLVANTKNNMAGIYLKQDKCEEALQAPSLQSLYIYRERERGGGGGGQETVCIYLYIIV
jgi:hypothetical protein